MRGFAFLALQAIAVIALGGCMGGPGGDGPAPRTYEFDLFMEPSSNGVVGLYPRNDNSTQGAVAITFCVTVLKYVHVLSETARGLQ